MSKKIKPTTLSKLFESIKIDENNRKKHFIRYFFIRLYYKILKFIKNIPFNIKMFIQRGQKGYSKKDTWDLFYYLSDIIEKSITDLKKYKYGSPIGFSEGQWLDILNSIIYTFYLAKQDNLIIVLNKKERKKIDKMMEKTNKQWGSNDRCMTDEEIRDYNKGWKLFKEHFFSLWD